MNDVGFAELVVRMLVSLAVVLGLVGAAYVVMRRRQSGGGAHRPVARRRTRPTLVGGGRARGTRGAGARPALRVVSRTSVSRSTSVVAVQFADRVLLVGASDHAAPAVLAEVDLIEWSRAVDIQASAGRHDDVIVVGERTDAGAPWAPTAGAGAVPGVARPAGLLDALREATARRG